MNIVFISPNFPGNFQHFCAQLSQIGVNVLGIDQVDYHHIHPMLRSHLKDYYKVTDLHHYHEVEQACDYFIKRHGPIHRVESHNEYWLQTQAKLTTRFQIPGLNHEQIDRIKRKSQMKQVFHTENLSPARGDLVHNLESALDLASHLGYPLMMKPDVGVGASGCCKIHNEMELRDFFKIKSDQDYVMEEFVNGDVFSFDGLTDQEGNLLFYTSHVYCSGIAEIVQQQLDQYYYSLRDIPPDLELIGRKTLQAYQVKERFFHFEFFRTHADKRLVPIEVNMRPPGGATLDMCNYACDIDLYHWWAKMIAGHSHSLSFERKYHTIAISRRYKNQYELSHREVLEKGQGLIVHHDHVPAISYPTMGDYFYLARSPDLQQLSDLQQCIQKIHNH